MNERKNISAYLCNGTLNLSDYLATIRSILANENAHTAGRSGSVVL